MKSSMESILGIILAGILYAAMPIHLLFLIVGLCYVASGVSEMLIRFEHQKPRERLTLRLAVRDMGEGISYLKTKRAILALLLAILFINFFFAPVMGNFVPYFVKTDLTSAPSYLLDHLLTPELWSSVFTVCWGISSLLGAAILSARPQAEKCGFKTALRLGAIAVLMLGFTLSFWLLVERGGSLNGFLIAFCLGCLGLGVLVSFVNIPISTTMMRVVDKDKLSKVNSIISMGSQGMIPLASVLAGAILETLGSTFLLVFCSLGCTVTAILLLCNKRIREL